MINDFVNKYQLSKTLRFELIPYGKTKDNFNEKHLLEEDMERDKNYKKAKDIMDKYYKVFIESALKTVVLNDIDKYSELYFKSKKSGAENEELKRLESSLREQIANAFTASDKYKSSFYEPLIKETLPEFLKDDDDKRVLEYFNKFTTYFKGFWQSRKNIFTSREISTGIPYRCINDNLPKFLDNVRSFEKIYNSLPSEDIEELDSNFRSVYNIGVEDVFCLDYFSFTLSQSGIDRYNSIIGGYTKGGKIQGVNEKVNQYNQKIAKSKGSKKLPFLKSLSNQILSDKKSISFIPEKFDDDNEVLNAVKEFYNDDEKGIPSALNNLNMLIANISDYNAENIYISSDPAVATISQRVFGSWSLIRDNWNIQYEKNHKKGKNIEKFYEKEKNEFKKIKSFSVAELQRLATSEKSITDYLSNESQKLFSAIGNSYKAAESLLTNEYKDNKRLSKNDEAVELIKNFLDSVKAYEYFLKPLCGTGKEEEKDELFYGVFTDNFDRLRSIDALYDKVRNYITKKPYTNDKIKLNFQNPDFLGGWDKNKETAHRSVLLRKNGLYYLGIMAKGKNKIFKDFPEDENSAFEKMEYKYVSKPTAEVPHVFDLKREKFIECYKPSDEIMKIYKSGSFKKGDNFNLDDCHAFIDFYKECIKKYKEWECYGFKFSDTKDYADISQFFKEVSNQGYLVSFRKISEEYLNTMVDNGSLYLFQLYSKDFSPNSKGNGTPNLHTLYFKMLFDEQNLSDVVYRLSGKAEMFYREVQIGADETIVHPKNQPINNKNPNNRRKQSLFEYDIIKDKRYVEYKFHLNLPIEMNYKAAGNGAINNDVRAAIKRSDKNYVIGIDRGERNLIYACVIDNEGRLVEQQSFNIIESDNGYKTDYHALLNNREIKMKEARKSWKTIGSIKELKEGYLSQVIHKICQLVVKYDAVVVLEELSLEFKNSRKKVEKQVYQKFETMLTRKLNYLVDKKADPNDIGGLLHAYQLTNNTDKASKSKSKNQDGIIFYVPAWLTSKIDPTTGFVNLFNPKSASGDSPVEFFTRFDDIKYNENEDYFEFCADYDKFPKCNSDFKKTWTICTFGERIEAFRNSEKNNEWDYKIVPLCEEFKSLFDSFGIDYRNNLKEQIVNQSGKDFFKKLTHLFLLTLQMRNSISGQADVDYIISPVKNACGEFYDSRKYNSSSHLPCDADANGAYNIAKKGLWAINQIKTAEAETKVNISISNAKWLQYAQTHNVF